MEAEQAGGRISTMLVHCSGFVISSGAVGKFSTKSQSLFLDFKGGLMTVTHCGNCEDCCG